MLLILYGDRLPEVALCVYRVGRVVVEVVWRAVETVVEEDVEARVVVCRLLVLDLADIDVLSADDGDTPEVVLYVVSCDESGLCLLRIIEVYAAAAVHRVCLVVVVYDGVVEDFGVLLAV